MEEAFLDKLKGKQVRVIFNDGSEVRSKVGTLLEIKDGFLILQSEHGATEAIGGGVIIRVSEYWGDKE